MMPEHKNRGFPFLVWQTLKMIIIVKTLYQFLFAVAFMGCFRMQEVLSLKWGDFSKCVNANNNPYISIRLNWHKTAVAEYESQIFYLYDENQVLGLKII